MKNYITYAKIIIECPYCAFGNEIILSNTKWIEMNVRLCDIEGGGCDKYFGYRLEKINVETSTYKMEKVNG